MDTFLSKYPSLFQYERLKELESKTGQPAPLFFVLIVTALSSVLYLLGGPKLLSDLTSFLYPAYMSFKSIDSSDRSLDAQWLTYWVVFGLASIAETCASFLVGGIPLYFVWKLGFFVWLWHPKTMGAGVVYTQAVRPFLLPYLEEFGVGGGSSSQKKVA